MIKVWYQEGVYGELIPEAEEGFRRLKRFWQGRQMGDIFVTSIREGTHLPHSMHYCGRAIDVRPPPKAFLTNDYCSLIAEAMGPGWKVIDETTHLHCQLDWRR